MEVVIDTSLDLSAGRAAEELEEGVGDAVVPVLANGAHARVDVQHIASEGERAGDTKQTAQGGTAESRLQDPSWRGSADEAMEVKATRSEGLEVKARSKPRAAGGEATRVALNGDSGGEAERRSRGERR